jgi:hypothetical protein
VNNVDPDSHFISFKLAVWLGLVPIIVGVTGNVHTERLDFFSRNVHTFLRFFLEFNFIHVDMKHAAEVLKQGLKNPDAELLPYQLEVIDRIYNETRMFCTLIALVLEKAKLILLPRSCFGMFQGKGTAQL